MIGLEGWYNAIRNLSDRNKDLKLGENYTYLLSVSKLVYRSIQDKGEDITDLPTIEKVLNTIKPEDLRLDLDEGPRFVGKGLIPVIATMIKEGIVPPNFQKVLTKIKDYFEDLGLNFTEEDLELTFVGFMVSIARVKQDFEPEAFKLIWVRGVDISSAIMRNKQA